MKKVILYGLIALVSVSMLFLGCSTGTSSDSSTVVPLPPDPGTVTPVNPVNAAKDFAADLYALIDPSTTDVVVTGSRVTINKDGADTVAISSGIIIPEGVTLYLEDDNLTVNGTITNNGALVLDKAKTATTTITTTAFTNNGSFSVASSGITLAGSANFINGNKGTISLEGPFVVPGTTANAGTITGGGGVTLTASGGFINNSGTINVSTGIFNISGDFTNANDGTGGTITGGTLAIIGGGTASNAGILIGAGGAILDVSAAASTQLANTGTIKVPLGTTFTVNNGNIVSTAGGLALAGTLNGTVASTGTLSVGGGGTLTALTNSGATITVVEGEELAIGAITNTSGIISVVGTLKTPASTGTLTNGGAINVTGTYIIGNNGTASGAIANTTGITVIETGTLKIPSVTNVGKVIVKDGGTVAAWNSTAYEEFIGAGIAATYEVGDDAIFSYTDPTAIFTVEGGEVTVKKDITLDTGTHQIVVNKDGTLNVSANITVDCAATPAGGRLKGDPTTTGTSAPALNIESGFKISLAGTPSTYSNLYHGASGSGTKYVAADIDGPLVFAWDPSADGTNAGWLTP
ncbi:MAG: hypothetical protein LBO65_02440 [Spirochaetaceae bacterium]|nr:hypothetical protein [Spirochaetaceae bacterium]